VQTDGPYSSSEIFDLFWCWIVYIVDSDWFCTYTHVYVMVSEQIILAETQAKSQVYEILLSKGW